MNHVYDLEEAHIYFRGAAAHSGTFNRVPVAFILGTVHMKSKPSCVHLDQTFMVSACSAYS